MTLAYLVSMKSKDPSTRVGAVIVGDNKEIISTGYNGLPRGIQDLPERYNNRNYKYLAGNHAEENAILHCAKLGISSRNSSLYVPWFPCAACSKMIIQAGIKEVIYHKEFPGNEVSDRWFESMEISKVLLEESGLVIRVFSGKIIEVLGLFNGNNFEL